MQYVERLRDTYTSKNKTFWMLDLFLSSFCSIVEEDLSPLAYFC